MGSEVTGGDLVTLWKVSKVHLPRVADVFGTASQLLGSGGEEGSGTADAVDAFATEGQALDLAYHADGPGHYARRPDGHSPRSGAGTSPIYPYWAQLRNELQYLTATTAQYALDASDAVNIALNMFRGVDEDNAASTTEAGKEFDADLLNPDAVDDRPGNSPLDEPPAEPEFPSEDNGDPYVSSVDHRSAASPPPTSGQEPV